jgi:hypothetical protein
VRHAWANGDRCLCCGLNRAGAPVRWGRYGGIASGGMQYWFDGDTERRYKAGPCEPKQDHLLPFERFDFKGPKP